MPALTAAAMNGNYAIPETPDVCHGCGLNYATGDQHRPDCTVEPSPLLCAQPACDAMRLPSERGQLWQYRPNTDSYFCPAHHQKGSTA